MKTEQEYQALADWAEHEMDLTQATGGVTQYGATPPRRAGPTWKPPPAGPSSWPS